MNVRRAATLFAVVQSLVATLAFGESFTFSVNLLVTDVDATSIGRASYTPPSSCLSCSHNGNHRLNGGFTSESWFLQANQIYEQQISEFVPSQPTCYTGFIEGWGVNSFYDSMQTIRKCTPCKLFLESSGSGSISGAATGESEHDCGVSITLTAMAATGSVFVGWGGSISSTSPTISFTLDASKSLTAFFEEQSSGGGEDDSDSDLLQDPGPTPLIVNLGTGRWSLSGADDPVSFDIDADGRKEKVTWTARGERLAFVARDLNGNGRIDDGSEFFGDASRLANGLTASNGFEALRELDLNHDGIVDVNDRAWQELMLWVDSNHDGECQNDELFALAGSSVLGLRTTHETIGRSDVHGNLFRFQSRLISNDGGERPYYDVVFRVID